MHRLPESKQEISLAILCITRAVPEIMSLTKKEASLINKNVHALRLILFNIIDKFS